MYVKLFLILLSIAVNGICIAADVDAFWQGGNWMDQYNWDTSEAPVDGADEALISNGYFAPLIGTSSVSLDTLTVSGYSGSSLVIADSSSLEVQSPADLNIGLTNGYGRIQVQDMAELNIPDTVYLGYGAASSGYLDILGGEVNFHTLSAAAYADGQAAIKITDGIVNAGYRIYLGYVGGSESQPAISSLEISGGQLVFDPNAGGSQYFMMGFNGTGYSVNSVVQSGGVVDLCCPLHIGDRNDNNLCSYSISDGILFITDVLANGYNWGSSYGKPVSKFEVVGTKPQIYASSYYQNSNSTLKSVITDKGISTIFIEGPAVFEPNSMMAVELSPDRILAEDTSYDILEADSITMEGEAVVRLIQTGSNYFCWTHKVVQVGTREVLRVTYKSGLDASFSWVTKKLGLWLDASNTNTLTSADGVLNDGDDISQWADYVISSEVNPTADDASQSTALKQPIWRETVSSLNNKSAIEFDGANTYLSMPTLGIGSHNTLFIVAQCSDQTSTSGSVHRPLIAADNNPYRSDGNGYGYGFTMYGVDQFIVSLGNGVSEEKNIVDITTDDAYRIYIVRRTGSTITEIFERQYGDSSEVLLSNSPGLSRILGLHYGYDIGANPPEHSGNAARFYLGGIAEIILFHQVLTDTDMGAVSDYLYEKYF